MFLLPGRLQYSHIVLGIQEFYRNISQCMLLVIGPALNLTEPDTLGVGPAGGALVSPPGGSVACWSLTTTGLADTDHHWVFFFPGSAMDEELLEPA